MRTFRLNMNGRTKIFGASEHTVQIRWFILDSFKTNYFIFIEFVSIELGNQFIVLNSQSDWFLFVHINFSFPFNQNILHVAIKNFNQKQLWKEKRRKIVIIFSLKRFSVGWWVTSWVCFKHLSNRIQCYSIFIFETNVRHFVWFPNNSKPK